MEYTKPEAFVIGSVFDVIGLLAPVKLASTTDTPLTVANPAYDLDE
jgi:hypothetical protein